MTYQKKLIEVALPLEAINRASAHEKSVPRRGHPATMHLWWSRKPLSTCRAVLFASIVDDPSTSPDLFPSEETQQLERERLFRIIEELVKWENTNNERVLGLARQEILRATDGRPPPVVDPFCGGGSIPLEAQRLGLRAHAGDLNPVAVLIAKSLIEIPPKFAGWAPINPESRPRVAGAAHWNGVAGLAEDVRYYGKLVRDEAERRIGHVYPKATLPKERGGGDATVIAWLWARTVRCSNPACNRPFPLASKFWVCTKSKKRVWVEPIVDEQTDAVRFEVRSGEGRPREGTVDRRGATCVHCDIPVGLDYIRAEGRAGRLSRQLMAIVADTQAGRVYLNPTDEHERIADSAEAANAPESALPEQALGFRVQVYGMTKHRDLFTPRQLLTLTMLSDLVREVRERAMEDATDSGLGSDARSIAEGGSGAAAYADAVATYLAFAVDKLADWSSTIAGWIPAIEGVRDTFARQAIPMTWDYAEINPLSDSVGNFSNHVEWVAAGLGGTAPDGPAGSVQQLDATATMDGLDRALVCTDPPYYDNIGYADLADFFFVWLRRTVARIYPDLFSTLLTPKQQELVATPFRFGGRRELADEFFENGLGVAFGRMRAVQDPSYPLTLFYAFKQAESDSSSDLVSALVSTGWEKMLGALLESGFAVSGTWPMRSERAARSVAIGANALASSIVLVCRPRATDAGLATRREFVAALRAELPEALRMLQQGNIAPVDLAQAAIGPGMAVFSRYAKVLESDGAPMSVRTALGLINQSLDEVLTEQESEYDPPTRWAVAWFDQHGMDTGKYGDAETLSKAKNVAVTALVEDGFLWSRGGNVRLLSREEFTNDWEPTTEKRLAVWDATQHLVRALDRDGESGAADLVRKLGSVGLIARDLAYRLYTTCERKKWAQEAMAYNALVVAWPEITRLARGEAVSPQGDLFE
jgi:putative DNA methylase